MLPDPNGDRTTRPVAFITGAAGGIGKAVVSRLRQRGVRVHATDLALAAIPCTEADFAATSLDVTDETAIANAVASCLEQFGRLDHVVHLAGRGGAGPLIDVALTEWRELLAINLDAAFLIAKHTAEALTASSGTLTLMASTNGLNGGSSLSGPAYAVAKAGIINLTRYLAKEWAARGIRVKCLAPGPIDTPMVGRFTPEIRARLIDSVPLQRLGTAAEIAAAVDYLTSPGAAFMTGTVMNISGGVVLD
jgi:NAD(P)-dependent dehydrogenase (short-subunit alcohol dehydrogenase family)